jgi:hypothetical protein
MHDARRTKTVTDDENHDGPNYGNASPFIITSENAHALQWEIQIPKCTLEPKALA